ncbi:MAG: SDR family NAD(P)-dependent oxidoreductase [Rhodobacteraceae bacterium]|nr:SDR family NAD(P)-dependent oxidoreductase [Paracoccaceae bacterium]
MTKDVDWNTVWITGASTGIGYELARLLDDKVTHLAVSSRSKDKLDIQVNQSRNTTAYPLDVTNAEAVATGIKSIEENAGAIDLAVLNAGTWALIDAKDINLESMRSGVEVNYMGVVNALNVLIPSMIERGSGHIAIVASVAGYRGLPRSIAYGPTKAALINLAETLRLELEPHGITVSVINPGFVDTPMTKDNPFPMPGMISAKEAAEAIYDGLKREKFEIAFPRAFVFAMKLLKRMPTFLYFWVINKVVMRS